MELGINRTSVRLVAVISEDLPPFSQAFALRLLNFASRYVCSDRAHTQ